MTRPGKARRWKDALTAPGTLRGIAPLGEFRPRELKQAGNVR